MRNRHGSRAARPRGVRITATEMVAPALDRLEVQRLLDVLDQGLLGAPDRSDNVTLRNKLFVALQVAIAVEKRRSALPQE